VRQVARSVGLVAARPNFLFEGGMEKSQQQNAGGKEVGPKQIIFPRLGIWGPKKKTATQVKEEQRGRGLGNPFGDRSKCFP